ncbi:acyl carrier protein [Verminephrobacter aporrectodeae subsp. tuberculatae]|uniref:Acyl carrier protein n=1 Tax=Verminephrobacter aporrectodeae subsp. tuberculatae TaxID=1110392 RepID=A0ABT3KUD3_9BURK|nr:phosphopantetheine-binding protein [Verminephrobacter aporrectodeae]MCW5321947.1 acyl carrier protein [Verminephrobacter aporrectodeae subsp. tuberculatae]MCW8199669.1 acyl carrier protein [Verminephrobacter aporrectodeae subsp. tuberculatae]
MTVPFDTVLRDTREQVHSVLLDIMPALNAASIDERLHLKELGADSVDRVEIIMSLRERFGLSVAMSRFSDVPDLRALIALLAELREERA